MAAVVTMGEFCTPRTMQAHLFVHGRCTPDTNSRYTYLTPSIRGSVLHDLQTNTPLYSNTVCGPQARLCREAGTTTLCTRREQGRDRERQDSCRLPLLQALTMMI